MRIIHLTRCTSWGGGERYALDLCARLSHEGHDVTVVSRGHPEMDAHFSSLPVRMERMPLGGILDLTSPFRLARLIESFPEEVTVVHVHNFKDAEIAARAKLLLRKGKRMRLVCTRHLVRPGKGGLRWKWIYDSIDSLVFVSRLAYDEFLSSRPPVDLSRLHVIHNSILPPPAPSAVAQAEGEALKVLFTGRIFPEKGVATLLKSATLLRDLPVELRIAGTGEGEYVAAMKELAREAGVSDRVRWLGFVPDVYEEIRGADICVAPSEWREPFGLTIIEYMSQGRPVVTTDNGAQPEIITDGADGILVPPGDAEALAGAIRRLAENPALRLGIGKAGRETFLSRFAYDKFYAQILREYQRE